MNPQERDEIARTFAVLKYWLTIILLVGVSYIAFYAFIVAVWWFFKGLAWAFGY